MNELRLKKYLLVWVVFVDFYVVLLICHFYHCYDRKDMKRHFAIL